MKQASFLQVVFFAVLLVVSASCGVPMGASGDYYEEAPARGNRYYGNSYGGTNTIIVERDPFTGRYYQISPGGVYGGIYGAPAYPYNQPRYYGRNNSSRSNVYYRKYPQRQPQQTPQRREQVRRDREQARETILGKKRN